MRPRLILYAGSAIRRSLSAIEDEDIARVKKALDDLGEYFDSVQIFCTRHEIGSDDGTISVVKGQGNWWARYGVVRAWADRKDEAEREQERHRDDAG